MDWLTNQVTHAHDTHIQRNNALKLDDIILIRLTDQVKHAEDKIILPYNLQISFSNTL